MTTETTTTTTCTDRRGDAPTIEPPEAGPCKECGGPMPWQTCHTTCPECHRAKRGDCCHALVDDVLTADELTQLDLLPF